MTGNKLQTKGKGRSLKQPTLVYLLTVLNSKYKVIKEAWRTPRIYKRESSCHPVLLYCVRRGNRYQKASEWEDSVRVNHLGSEHHHRSPYQRKGIRFTMSGRLSQERSHRTVHWINRYVHRLLVPSRSMGKPGTIRTALLSFYGPSYVEVIPMSGWLQTYVNKPATARFGRCVRVSSP